MARVPDLKFGNPEFMFRPEHQLDLFQLVPGSVPQLHLYI